MKDKKIFIVVGPHRSGTSLVTNVLSKYGLELGDNLIEPSSDNRDGFFEDSELVECNIAIENSLNRSHMHSSAILPFPNGWMDFQEVKEQEKKIEKVLLAKLDYCDNNFPLIKDPRLCRLLPLYNRILFKNNIQTVVFFCFRTPNSIVRSKSQRDLIAPEVVETFVQISAIEALKEINASKIECCFLNFELLFDDESVFKNKIRSFLNKFIAVDSVKESPKINKNGFHERKKIDIASYPVKPYVSKLFRHLIDLSNVDYTSSYRNQSLGFVEAHEEIIENAKPWLLEIDSNSRFINSYDDQVRKNERLMSDLKKSNSKVFDLERVKLDYEVKIQELKALADNKDMEVKRYQNKFKSINSECNKLKQKEQIKVFKIADGVHNVMHRKRNTFFFRALSKLAGVLHLALQRVRRFQRAVSNKGLKYAVILAVTRVSSPVTKKLWGTHKNYEKRALLIKAFKGFRKFNFDKNQKELLIGLFQVSYYLEKAQLDSGLSPASALRHFLDTGMENGLSPGPMFDSEVCTKKMSQAGGLSGVVFLDWLNNGASSRIIPTELFDELYYLEKNNVELESGEWSFKHFLNNVNENNSSPHRYFEPSWYLSHHSIERNEIPAVYHYLTEGYKKGWRPSPLFPSFPVSQCETMEQSPLELVLKQTKMSETQERLLSKSGIIFDILDKAEQIEPEIHSPVGHRRINIPPYNTPIYPAIKEVRTSLKYSEYDTVVLVPHIRIGGSGLVAGELCKAITNIYPNEKLLLIRTDRSDFMRPDWFPVDIDITDLSSFASDMTDLFRKKLLLDILIGVQPKRVFNVHSRLGWIVFSEYGDRLKSWSSLYGYSFCYDLNASGEKVGYQIKYIPDSINNMKTLFVDNSFLKKDLVIENKWSRVEENKIEVIFTPPLVDNIPIAVKSLDNRKLSAQKKVFWAGRFDRQKNFNIVVQLAKRNPELEFWVWGKAMLGDSGPLDELPPNVKLNGVFESYEDIPFEECDVWLYTSLWDGVPTILIELGLRAIPIVATQVWGTEDVINSETAWPVDSIEDVHSYEIGLHVFLSNPEMAMERGVNMRRHILKQHNRTRYASLLQEIIKDDVRGRVL